VVYRARQKQAQRLVALKVLAAGQFAAPDFVRRFRTEAEAAANLDHPHLVPIYEVGECDGQPYYSMKFVEGGSLAARIAAAPMPEREAATLVAKLASAVHYAHQRSILHRDIKPANVLLDAAGEPHLTDFGLAKLLEKDSTLTRTMAMLGTPSYMAPEQARGESRHLTTAADVYGLGAVFYELLTGQPPFAGGTTMATVRLVLDTEPRRPSAIRHGVDRDLETICLRCLAKEPASRYGSAEALAEDIGRWLRHEPIVARPVSEWERALKWVRRHPAAAALTGVALLAVAASVAILVRANVQINAARQDEQSLREQAERQAEERRGQLVRFNVHTGNQLIEDGEDFESLLWFTAAMRLENGDAAREDMHRRRFAAVLNAAPVLERVLFHEGFVNSAEFSPDGTHVLSSSEDKSARIWNMATGEAVSLMHSGGVRGARFTPDGKRVFTAAGGKLYFWDAVTGTPAGKPQPTSAADTDGVSFSPDGLWYAVPTAQGVQLFNAKNGMPGPLFAAEKVRVARFNTDSRFVVGAGADVLIWDMAGGGNEEPRRLPLLSGIRGLDFSRNGRGMATTTVEQLCVWDLAEGKPLPGWPIRLTSNSFDCRFSPDGRLLVVPAWDGTARVFDSGTGLLAADAMRHRVPVRRARFSPNGGAQVATASWDSTARLWYPAKGRAASPALPHAGYVTDVNFSPDGTALVTAGQEGTLRLWSLRKETTARLTLQHEGGASWMDVSPDGNTILSCGQDGNVRLWDFASGHALHVLPHGCDIKRACFSPDSRKVATVADDGAARLWDAESGAQLLPPIEQSKKALRSVAFSRDGTRLIVGGRDGVSRVWNVDNGQPVTGPMTVTDPGPIRIPERSVASSVAFSPDGRRVVTANYDGTAQVRDALTGEPVGTVMNHDAHVYQASFSPDGRRILTACSDATQFPRAAQMWDAETGLRAGPPLLHQDGVLSAEFSPDGRFIATGGENPMAIIWDGVTGARLTPPMPHSSYVLQVRFSPDSRLLLTVCNDGTARVWESATGEPVTPPLRAPGNLVAGAWDAGGHAVVTAAVDGTISIWDVSPVTGSVDSLQRRAEVISARHIVPDIGAVPLTMDELRARQDAVRPR
jgi:WD40 repeat protein